MCDAAGRDLAGKLRLTEAQPLLNEAVSKDPNFALAHLYLAQTAETPKGFFDHLKAAVAAAGKVSEGELLHIQGVEAGSNRETKLRGECYQKLVAAFPDDALMAGNAATRGELLLNAGKIKDAEAEYAKALELAQQADIPDRVKKNVELTSHGGKALVASAKKDFKTAKAEAEIMRAGFEATGNPNQIREAHEVLGIIALNEKNYDDAVAQLTQANAQSPYVTLQLAKAYAGKKDRDNSKTYYRKAAETYILPDTEYAMIRQQAKKAMAK